MFCRHLCVRQKRIQHIWDVRLSSYMRLTGWQGALFTPQRSFSTRHSRNLHCSLGTIGQCSNDFLDLCIRSKLQCPKAVSRGKPLYFYISRALLKPLMWGAVVFVSCSCVLLHTKQVDQSTTSHFCICLNQHLPTLCSANSSSICLLSQ